jgi:hypothetical protein
MLRRVALVRTDVSDKNRWTSSQIFVTLMKEALSSFETSVLTRTTRRNIPEDTILHSHRRENLKSYIVYLCLLMLSLLQAGSIYFVCATPGRSISAETKSALQFVIPCRYPEYLWPIVGRLYNNWSEILVKKTSLSLLIRRMSQARNQLDANSRQSICIHADSYLV